MSTPNKKKKSKEELEDNLFIQLITRYVFYWPLFLFLTITFASAAYVYIRYATPKYEANATIIIKDEKKGIEDSKAMEALNTINTKKIIENEIEVLQSRAIMNKVVKELHLYAPVFQVGKIRTLSAYTLSPITIIAKNPDSIKLVEKINFKYDEATGVILLNNLHAYKINLWCNTPYGELKFIKNKNYAGPIFDKPFFFSLIPVKDVTKTLLRDLVVVQTNKLSTVISLNFRDESSYKAEYVLNELLSMYERAAVEEKNTMAKNTLKFVEERLNAVADDLDSIEKSVQNYKADREASDISTQGQLYLQNVSSNDQELGKINMQLAVLDQVEESMKNGNLNAGGMMPSTLGANDPTLTKLMDDLTNKELEYEKLKKTVAENNPLLQQLKSQINKIKPSIAENLHTQRNSLVASKSDLMATNKKYNSMLSTIPKKEREILEMSRDKNVKSGIYSFLLQKREESELSYASTLSDSRIINSAQSSKFPVSPNKMLIMLGAIVAALAVGLGVITAKEGFATNILYRKDLESMTLIPVIGELAQNEGMESIVIEKGKRSMIAEEFRKIRVALHFLGINTEKKKILITSSIPGEGKSFVAANLAISNALTGKKVILIDADLHNPGLGKMFGKTTAEKGLSDYLCGQLELSNLIQPIANYDNLFFLSSGAIHESPSELLLNGNIEKLITELQSQFDMIIIDTAPSVLITDAYILTELCDATLYVVRHNHTPKMIIKRLDESLEINPLKNTGIIFNGVKKRGFSSNNYGYGYDYVYGKDYYKEKKKK